MAFVSVDCRRGHDSLHKATVKLEAVQIVSIFHFK